MYYKRRPYRRYKYKPAIGSGTADLHYHDQLEKFRKHPKWKFQQKHPIFTRPKSKAYKAIQIAKRSLKETKPELKYVDNNQINAPDIATPDIIVLNGIAQGVQNSQRKGNQVLLKDLQLRLAVAITELSSSDAVIRIVVLIDRQANMARPTMAQVFEVTTNVLSPLNRDFRDRFTILVDEVRSLQRNYLESATLTWYKKLNVKETFDGVNAAIEDISTNSVILILWSNNSGANSPGYGWFSRIRYTDM